MTNIMKDVKVGMGPSEDVDPIISSGQLDADTFVKHPVVTRKKTTLHYERIRPVSLFCDSAQYTKRDSFFGFYMRDMRTGREFVNFIISSLVMHSGIPPTKHPNRQTPWPTGSLI